jgi:hypothetical protein
VQLSLLIEGSVGLAGLGLVSPEQVVRHILEQGVWREPRTWQLMLVVWLMLIASAGTWIFLGRTRAGYKVTSVYWLGCGLGIWLSLYLPPHYVLPSVVCMIAVLSFIFAFLPIWRYKWRWFHAWPDHLEILTYTYRPPSGLITSVTALSLVVFFLCLCNLCRWSSVASSLLLGTALLALVSQEYRSEAGLAGMVLISLGLVSGFLAITGAVAAPAPTVVNLVLIPLSVLSLFWISTAARLVPLTRHVGVMLLGFSTLLGIKLSLWPILPAVSGDDNHGSRFVLMGVAFLLLLACNIGIARIMKLSSLGVLTALNLFALIMAVVTRFPGFLKRVFLPHWPVMVVGYVVVALVVGILLTWRRQKE